MLVSLAEQSLIVRDPRATGGPGIMTSGIRFGVLTTVQGFALRRLIESGREAAARSRHALAYLALAEDAAGHLWAAGQGAWLDRLALDHPNLRAALRWSIEARDVETALRLVAALWRFWQLDGHVAEGHSWVAAVLAMPGADEPTPARLSALGAAGGIAYWRGDRQRARDLYRSQLSLAEQLGDRAGEADAYINLAAANFVTGDPAESARCEEEARRLYVDLGDEVGANRASWGAANLAYDREGPEAGLAAMMAVHQRTVEISDAVYEALTCGSIAWTYNAMGDMPSAAAWAIASMLGSYRLRDLGSTTVGLPIGALIALESGRPEDAAVIVGAFEELCERYGVQPPLGLGELIRRADPLGRIATTLDPDVMAAAIERGRRTSLGDAVELIERIGRDAEWLERERR
jgi:tetratricopeptide (TPR) repeat protein